MDLTKTKPWGSEDTSKEVKAAPLRVGELPESGVDGKHPDRRR